MPRKRGFTVKEVLQKLDEGKLLYQSHTTTRVFISTNQKYNTTTVLVWC